MTIRTIKAMIMGPQKEALTSAGSSVYPGDLLQLHTDGTVKEHATAGGTAQAMFAIEDSLQGKEVAEVYTAATLCRYVVPNKGDEVNAILADGENAAIGSFLESNGDGALRVQAPSSAAVTEFPNSTVGQAMEALDASDSATTALADRRLRVEIT